MNSWYENWKSACVTSSVLQYPQPDYGLRTRGLSVTLTSIHFQPCKRSTQPVHLGSFLYLTFYFFFREKTRRNQTMSVCKFQNIKHKNEVRCRRMWNRSKRRQGFVNDEQTRAFIVWDSTRVVFTHYLH